MNWLSPDEIRADNGYPPMSPQTMKRELLPELSDIQWRDAGDGSANMNLGGHAAVFNRLSDNLGGFRERIAPGAFTEVLAGAPDVRLLIDHKPSSVLARTLAGTLTLSEDEVGLGVRARIPQALTEARDLRIRMENSLVTQMSFAFQLTRDDEEEIGEDADGVPIWQVNRVRELYDASIVTFAAYPQTDAALLRMRVCTPDVAPRQRGGPEDTTSTQSAGVQVDLETQHRLRALRAHARLCIVRYPVG